MLGSALFLRTFLQNLLIKQPSSNTNPPPSTPPGNEPPAIFKFIIVKNEQMDQVDEEISSCRKKVSLDFSYCELGGEIGSLCKLIQSNKNIVSLNLTGNNFNKENIHDICKAVQANPNITSLKLRECNIRNDSINDITALLRRQTLTSINLSGNLLTNKTAASIGNAIGKNKNLTSLNLSWNRFNNLGALKICESLAANDCLKSLKIEGEYIQNEKKHIAAFNRALPQHNHDLVVIV